MMAQYYSSLFFGMEVTDMRKGGGTNCRRKCNNDNWEFRSFHEVCDPIHESLCLQKRHNKLHFVLFLRFEAL